MKFFYKVLLIVLFIGFTVSCSKSDNTTTVPLRDYAEQYATDIAKIEDFLHSYSMEVTNHPGFTDDQDVVFTKIPEGGGQTSIWDQTVYPLQTHLVEQNGITYKIYYLQLRQGQGESPCNVDDVLVSYKGNLTTETNDKLVKFDELIYPQAYLNLASTIKGWSEIVPKFKTGTYNENTDGTLSYQDFGAGVMFLPSGLGYYSNAQTYIPSYSPLIFTFKLYAIHRVDNDKDGVPSYMEDIDGDGYFRVLADGVFNPDDTDGDGILNFLDIDDDGDHYSTISEITNPETGKPFSFEEIPTCDGGNGKKKHLDPSCY